MVGLDHLDKLTDARQEQAETLLRRMSWGEPGTPGSSFSYINLSVNDSTTLMTAVLDFNLAAFPPRQTYVLQLRPFACPV